ncbi:MAG: hypothetical protein NTY39_10480 [Campylobacterales bacterium]|nr:hypothetical protein [Campylobacterales bacterium]
MNNFKWLFFIILVIFGTNIYANEAKGYKIILASYPKFDQAKKTMNLLGQKLTKKDWSIQKKYRYEIVARPSGKVFIVAIEPLRTKEAVNSVLIRFKKFYPNAYYSGYFGPTKGGIFLIHPSTAKITKDISTREENFTPPNPPEKSVSKWGWAAAILGLVAIGIFLKRMRKTSRSTINTFQEKIEKKVEIIPKEADREIKADIFDTLKKNRFFMLLINELIDASNRREEQQCHDLIQEMRRYEKKFLTSRIITDMEELINAKKFTQLSELITLEREKS